MKTGRKSIFFQVPGLPLPRFWSQLPINTSPDLQSWQILPGVKIWRSADRQPDSRADYGGIVKAIFRITSLAPGFSSRFLALEDSANGSIADFLVNTLAKIPFVLLLSKSLLLLRFGQATLALRESKHFFIYGLLFSTSLCRLFPFKISICEDLAFFDLVVSL